MIRHADDVMTRGGYRLVRIGSGALLLRPSKLWVCMGGLVLLMAFALAMLPLGVYDASWADLWQASAQDDVPRLIWQDIRLPRILMALLAGAMLGAAGAALQSLARNGLADPGLVGVKDGAACAVVAVAVFAPQLEPAWRGVIGLAGGLAVGLAVVLLARDMSKVRFILVGIGVSWLLHGLVACFITTADIRDVQTAMIWMAGSLHAASWDVLAPTLIWAMLGLALLLGTSRASDAMMLGYGTATSLGASTRRIAALRFLAACLLTSAAVAAVGSLGFVGLIAPHLSRLSLGGKQLALLVGSALYGAGLVLVADSLGRLLFAPLQIPAGVVMAVVGVPFLLVLVWRRREQF